MRKVMQGVTHGFAALAVGPADPEAAVVAGVVESVAGGLQQVGQVVHPDLPQHFGGSAVGGDADHAGEGVAGGGVELHLAGLDAGEGAEKNGDLGQARCIDHVVGIDGGEAGALRIGDVGQRDRQVALVHGVFEAEVFQLLFELGLQARINGLFEFRIGLAGVDGNRQ